MERGKNGGGWQRKVGVRLVRAYRKATGEKKNVRECYPKESNWMIKAPPGNERRRREEIKASTKYDDSKKQTQENP